MKRMIFIAMVVMLAASASADQSYNLPELHVLKSVTLAPCYSCRSQEDFQKGYSNTALFLSDYSKRHNSPDLLFNGFRGGEDYFEASTAGDDMALIADLGQDASIEKLTAHNSFNLRGVHSYTDYSRFAKVAKVEKNHTYAVLLSKAHIRGLYVFTVVDYVPNQRVELRYAVKEYQIIDVKAQAAGFDWGKENAEKPEANQN